tara:strand:- start:1308 stop:2084 length:777 start_codon:yes stop_codon:yes gene_type:complete
MGTALLISWIKSKRYIIDVVDPNKYHSLKKNIQNKNLKVYKSISFLKSTLNYDFIVLAIKPSDLKLCLDHLNNISFKRSVILTSVVAGKKISVYEKNLNNIKNIVRVMPNMPALIGQSMNCLFSKSLDTKKNNIVKKLFNYTGETIWLKSENQIDMATAVSGSGPGYIYNLVDAMEKAAIKLGFDKNTANTLVIETFKGSINVLLKDKKNAEKLVKTVATKGGTTEAGLKIMDKHNIHNIFNKLIRKSYIRAKEQGKK